MQVGATTVNDFTAGGGGGFDYSEIKCGRFSDAIGYIKNGEDIAQLNKIAHQSIDRLISIARYF